MYNVLVVDDEWMICNGVAAVLRNSDIAIGDVMIANNGFEALDYIRLDPIDLLITDIQMEGMNGIELIETLFSENPLVPVIVLSAHGEFEYAQKALRFGVKEYIIKPVVPDELIRVVRALLMERESKLRMISEASFKQKFSFEDMSTGRHILLNEWVSEGFSETEAEEAFRYLGKRLDGPCYGMLAVKLLWPKSGAGDDEALTFRDRNLLRYASLNIIEETLNRWDCLTFYSGTPFIAVILQFTRAEMNAPGLLSEQTMVAQLLHNHLRHYLKIESAIGISRIREGILSWSELFREAVEATRWSEVHPDHAVFYIGDFSSKRQDDPAAGTVPDPRRTVEDNNSFIRDAIQYIGGHYRRKGLKLQEIADAVCLSPNYLSYLFKKIAGYNMWDYVTKLRMEEARRLIMTTDMRRYEISDEVGYESPEHFTKIFKKYYGVNPSEMKDGGIAAKQT
ncbi:response regulator [Cohnella caldifontis]|uniref:response regulator n=1 Tax=Cohnella caldifontis TaxID=3027471 RepID=UPI0023ECE392|nr:response regulator [Cohnella sp. YIM B05605]